MAFAQPVTLSSLFGEIAGRGKGVSRTDDDTNNFQNFERLLAMLEETGPPSKEGAVPIIRIGREASQKSEISFSSAKLPLAKKEKEEPSARVPFLPEKKSAPKPAEGIRQKEPLSLSSLLATPQNADAEKSENSERSPSTKERKTAESEKRTQRPEPATPQTATTHRETLLQSLLPATLSVKETTPFLRQDPLAKRTQEFATLDAIRQSRDMPTLLRVAQKAGLNLQSLVVERPAQNSSVPLSQSRFVPENAITTPSVPTTLLLSETKKQKSLFSKTDTAKNPLFAKASRTEDPLASLLSTRRESAATPETAAAFGKDAVENLETLFAKFSRPGTAKNPQYAAEGKRGEERTVDNALRAPLPESSEPLSPEPAAVQSESKSAHETLGRKIIDAKETVRHFAAGLREQVENYKPPLHRIRLSLEPRELGSVEVTLLSRGSNLHVQVHSNPTAVGVMALQGQELKNQLVSMGFSDVQMQFGMNQQHQQRQQRHDGRRFDADRFVELEEIPDLYESLELIVPQYV